MTTPSTNQLDFWDPISEEREPEDHRATAISRVKLRPHTSQLWPPCVDGWPEEDRNRIFGNLPLREKLYVWEVADFLRVSRVQVYRLIWDGSLMAVNVARSEDTRPDYRLLRCSVVEWVCHRLEGAE